MNQNQSEGAGDPLFDATKAFVIEEQRVSISMIQRKHKIGYMRANNLVNALEEQKVVSSPTHNGRRAVLVSKSQ
tara:strand:+ start:1196 stop:1417 length:222 start_codon:yes stop_codon:yes gene_type:complete